MKGVSLIVLPFLVAGLQGCGGGGGSGGNASGTVSFSIPDASTDVALNAAVSATFSVGITEPSNWSDVFTLKKDGAGENLCTAIAYDSAARVATCAHAEFDGGGSHTIANSGLAGVADAAATFTAGSEIAVSLGGKTSVAFTAAGNDVALTFSFSSAVPAGWVPAVSVTGPDGAELAVSGCAFNGDRTAYTCTVSGVAGCATFSDYAVAVAGTGGFQTRFNAADDEFESADALSNCWVQSEVGATISITADRTLRMVLPTSVAANLDKSFSGAGDIAVLTRISSVSRPQTSGDEDASINTALRDASDTRSLTFGPVNYAGKDKVSLLLNTGSGSYHGASPLGGSSLLAATDGDGPFSICMVRSNNTVKTYLSTDGATFTRLSADNMTCFGCSVGIDAIVEAAADWASVSRLWGYNEVPGATLTGEYDFIRFRTTGITGGSSDDCPPL